MRVLITGGAGYLGSVLARRLLENGHSVRVIDNLLFGSESIKELESNDRFHLMVGDIGNLQDVTTAMQDIDAVIALAAIVGDPACKINDRLSIKTNYWATKLLAQVASSQGVRKFLFASTCSVYGLSENTLSTEDSWTNPLSLYAETKIDSEKALVGMNGTMKPVIMRLSTLCGPSYRMRFDLVMNIMTATAFFENEVRIYGGSQIRPLLDVRDAARAFQLFLDTPSEEITHSIYNVGAPSHNIAIKDLGKIVAREMGDVQIINKPDVTDSRSYAVDFSRIRKLGFNDVLSLEESIQGISQKLHSKEITDYKLAKYYNSRYDYLSMPT